VRQCCLDLLSLDVSVQQVEPVIKPVLKDITRNEVENLELYYLAFRFKASPAEEVSDTTDIVMALQSLDNTTDCFKFVVIAFRNITICSVIISSE